MIITEQIIPLIEKALGFELYENQKSYLLGKSGMVGGRVTGKTTAYCVKLLLTDGEPLNLKKSVEFADGWSLSNHRSYAMGFFRHELVKIHDKLKNHGFHVRELVK